MSLHIPPSPHIPSPIPVVHGNVAPHNNALPLAMPGNGGQALDIWGPLQRRKYLVSLFVLVGLGLGYLYYSRTPKTYSSSAQLMISTQAPPTFVDGNLRLEKVSLSKHASMIASEKVLLAAVEKGSLGSLPMFRDTVNIVGALKNLLTLDSEADEVLTISCLGSNPDDLVTVLNEVIAAYQREIQLDSVSTGEEARVMIQKLKESLETDKDSAARDLEETLAKLDFRTFDNSGRVVNPYEKPALELQEEISRLNRSLFEVADRERLLRESLQPNPETGVIDPIQIKVAAIEAQDYLKLDRTAYQQDRINEYESSLTEDVRQRAALAQQILTVENQLTELRFEEQRMSRSFGPGYKAMADIREQVNFYEEKLRELEGQDQQLASAIEQAKDNAHESTSSAENGETSVGALRDSEDRQWITMYDLALQKEQSRLESSIKKLTEDKAEIDLKRANKSEDITKINTLQRMIEKKDQEVAAIMDQIKEMDILSGSYTTTRVKLLDDPKRGKVVAPSLPKSLALGGMLAFLLGVGFAVLVDRSEFAFHSPSEIFERLQVPVVGKIPRINIRQIEPKLGHASLIAAHKPAATASESFRDVRTALFFRANMDDIKTILFTSPSPGDGKSTTVANLAISIAQAGKKVVLVDADFRRPRMHQYFGQEISPGLLDVLSGEKTLVEAVQTAQLQENLFLLPAGGRPGNPGELVTSEAFRNLIDALRDRFDYVLIDSPPVLPVSDPATIASLVDGVYLVTRIRKGVKLTSHRAKETLDRVGANWMGIIVNGLDENPHYSEYGYQYGSYSYYGGMYGRYYSGSTGDEIRDKIATNS